MRTSIAQASYMAAAEGWTPDTRALVERAIDAHGGWDRWRDVRSIHLPFVRGSGGLLTAKGFRRTFPAPASYEVRPHQEVAIFHGYPDPRHYGRYEAGSVSVAATIDDSVVASSSDHRRTFAGLCKYRRWSPLDALYFFGYALVHYHALPFTLGAARALGVVRHGASPCGLDVLFPPGVHTHSPRQRFYFGGDGRIVRHDYVAEVIGPLARGAHLWEDYEPARGLLIARRRRVVWRLVHWPSPIVVLDIELGQPTVA